MRRAGDRSIFEDKAEGAKHRRALGMDMVAGSPLIVLLRGEEELKALPPAMTGIIGELEIVACVMNGCRRVRDRSEDCVCDSRGVLRQTRPGADLGGHIGWQLHAKTPTRNLTAREQKILELVGAGMIEQVGCVVLIEAFKSTDHVENPHEPGEAMLESM